MTTYHRFRDLVTRGYVKNRMTLKRRIDAGVFPRPVHLGPNSVAWTDEQLAEVDARIAAGAFRDATPSDQAEPTAEPQAEKPLAAEARSPKGLEKQVETSAA